MTPAAFIASASAVADPTRLRILCQLEGGPRSVGELAGGVGISSSAVSYHVTLMREAGLVVAHRAGRQTIVRRVERRWAAIVKALATAE